MVAQENNHQLGDFIKGRFDFIRERCEKAGLDFDEIMEKIHKETLHLAGSEEKKAVAEERLFEGAILSSTFLPDWLDKIFLEAISRVLQGPGSSLFTTSSERPCIAFEAGRFNARRQAAGVFRVFFSRKTPEEWLKTTFRTIYRQCYGEEAANRLLTEKINDKHFKVYMDNRGLEKASPIDCSTVIGYLYGGLENLGAEDILVTHATCALLPGSLAEKCEYDVTWR